ncbi:hypothetical protein VPH49_25885 [Pseudomonas luteola]|uniref:hypothetical protein n=1 Tax=Pseudomonas luteola TaxID=47886 RepID=UPI003A835E7E
MDNDERIASLENNMKLVAEALIAVSEANGCALDGLLALWPSLSSAGLLEKEQDGKVPFVEALKAQHRELHNLNKLIAVLLKEYGLEGESKLSPSP